jgi:hypothetical protein
MKLSKDENYLVREVVVRNPNCPMEILRKLSSTNLPDPLRWRRKSPSPF